MKRINRVLADLQVNDLRDENERLRRAVSEAYEIYADYEAFKAETAPEAYLQQLLEQIAVELATVINGEKTK